MRDCCMKRAALFVRDACRLYNVAENIREAKVLQLMT